jgi:hypothetical protein
MPGAKDKMSASSPARSGLKANASGLAPRLRDLHRHVIACLDGVEELSLLWRQPVRDKVALTLRDVSAAHQSALMLYPVQERRIQAGVVVVNGEPAPTYTGWALRAVGRCLQQVLVISPFHVGISALDLLGERASRGPDLGRFPNFHVGDLRKYIPDELRRASPKPTKRLSEEDVIAVIQHLAKAGSPMQAMAIAVQVGLPLAKDRKATSSKTREFLARMVSDGLLIKPGDGYWMTAKGLQVVADVTVSR